MTVSREEFLDRLRASMDEPTPERVPRALWRGAAIVVMAQAAFVFAIVGVWMLTTSDPTRAVSPFCVALFLAWCVWEIVRSGVGLVRVGSARPSRGDAPSRVDEN